MAYGLFRHKKPNLIRVNTPGFNDSAQTRNTNDETGMMIGNLVAEVLKNLARVAGTTAAAAHIARLQTVKAKLGYYKRALEKNRSF